MRHGWPSYPTALNPTRANSRVSVYDNLVRHKAFSSSEPISMSEGVDRPILLAKGTPKRSQLKASEKNRVEISMVFSLFLPYAITKDGHMLPRKGMRRANVLLDDANPLYKLIYSLLMKSYGTKKTNCSCYPTKNTAPVRSTCFQEVLCFFSFS